MRKVEFAARITLASELRIIYHQVAQDVIEFGAYFVMNVTIIYPDAEPIIYTIDGGEDWGIVGKAKVIIPGEQKETEVTIKAMPIKYGRIAIPKIKVWLVEGKGEIDKTKEGLEGWVSGNEQMIIVVPKNIVNAIPVPYVKH